MSSLVLITGDKGGVGKSFTSRAVLDWLFSEGRKVEAFDTDKTNSTLFRFFREKVRQVDFEKEGHLDELLNSLSEQSEDEIVMVDCAARSLDHFVKWMKEVDFLEIKKDLKLKLTLVFVLGPEKDCLAILKDVVGEFEDNANYLIVKNLGKGSDFDLYNNSKTRKMLEKYNAREIELPRLLEKTTLLIDRLNLSFSKAMGSSDVQIADRSRVRLFNNTIKERFSEGLSQWM